jgi:F0F1-type ATP synthase membrane subunit b/b'
VDLAIQAAEKVIQEKLSEKSDRRLVEDFIKGIEKK